MCRLHLQRHFLLPLVLPFSALRVFSMLCVSLVASRPFRVSPLDVAVPVVSAVVCVPVVQQLLVVVDVPDGLVVGVSHVPVVIVVSHVAVDVLDAAGAVVDVSHVAAGCVLAVAGVFGVSHVVAAFVSVVAGVVVVLHSLPFVVAFDSADVTAGYSAVVASLAVVGHSVAAGLVALAAFGPLPVTFVSVPSIAFVFSGDIPSPLGLRPSQLIQTSAGSIPSMSSFL